MSKYKSQGFAGTYRNALKGVRLALKSEKNIRVHFSVALIVLVAAVILDFSAVELCVLLLTISIVIIAEMVNSAIEFSLDAIFHNRYSKLVGMAKDIAAGAVMVATYTSVAVGILLFGSRIIDLGCL